MLAELTKEQLLGVADFYGIPIASADRKLKDLLVTALKIGLVEKGVPRVKSGSPLSAEGLEKSGESFSSEIRLKEMSLQEKQMQLEAAKLRADREARGLREKELATWEQLCELILLEEFKDCVPEAVATHLNDQKVSTLAQAAICADEFVLTHTVVFYSVSRKPDRDVSF
uniref:Uncharacterized protein n=1 Tax=Denticeps clupeoides TaxID=299321 RepID=A0AAY4AAH2_9TELE